jgi:hypothetical protein
MRPIVLAVATAPLRPAGARGAPGGGGGAETFGERAAVGLDFAFFSESFEGRLPFMYLDDLGLVTTGVGDLIDPVSLATALPWEHKSDGHPASPNEVRAEWAHVKSLVSLDRRGGSAFGAVTTLRLSAAAVTALLTGKLADVDGQLARRFRSYPQWPADGQLGTLSIAWAAGSAWAAPKFQAHADAQPTDFVGCATECGVHTARDPVNRILFRNAAHVVAAALDPDVLYYPRVLGPAIGESVPADPQSST